MSGNLILVSQINSLREQLSSKIGKDNPISTGLSLSPISQSSPILADNINETISAINSLQSKDFFKYADYPSFSSPTPNKLLTEESINQIELAIESLKNICQNYTERKVHTSDSYTTGNNNTPITSGCSDNSNFSNQNNCSDFSDRGNSTCSDDSNSSNSTCTDNSDGGGYGFYSGSHTPFWTCANNHESSGDSVHSGNGRSSGNNVSSGNGKSTGNNVSNGFGKITGNNVDSGDSIHTGDNVHTSFNNVTGFTRNPYNNNTPIYTTYNDFSVKYTNGAYQVITNSNVI